MFRGALALPERRRLWRRVGGFLALRGSAALGLILGSIVLLAPSPAAGKSVRGRVASGQTAVLVDLEKIYLEALPERGEGWNQFCRRLTGSTVAVGEIIKLNRASRKLLAGVRYRVPYALLRDELKLAVVQALFPEDRPGAEGWTHRSRGESLSAAVDWLTGDRTRVEQVRRAAGLAGGSPAAGDTYRIPNDLLLAPFRFIAAATPAARPAPEVLPTISSPAVAGTEGGGEGLPAPLVAVSTVLEYAEDERGKFAIYRLRAGEALYSSVVIRFTGRLHAEDVNALAGEIAGRSGIADVTDIPIGFPVKIPFEVLLPEHLPASDPRRLEYEVEQRLSGQYRNEVRASGLEGVLVILDAGHGGVDVGASMSGVWESLYVYDIAMRIQRALTSRTRAEARLTTRDGAAWRIDEKDVLAYSRKHAVLTTPPYPIVDARIGVHLRWYLANSLFRKAAAKSGGGDKVVFLSIHADSLHASLRGATAYIPDTAGTGGTYRKSGGAFASRQEVKEQPEVRFSLKERQRSEGLSRDLAQRIIAAFSAAELDVHPFKPVRDRIYRGRRAWVPAVLKYNAVPAKLLLEVCNLANSADRKLLQTRVFREQVANAVVQGLLSYFGARQDG